MPTNIEVEIHGDLIESKLIPVKSGFSAIAELIWNGFDADAAHVDVSFVRNTLGGIAKIVITDDGDGIDSAEAATCFKGLGGSWKRTTRQTRREGRLLHGKGGSGRFKAYALGTHVTWDTCYEDTKGRRHKYRVSGDRGKVTTFEIGDVVDGSDTPRGTIVTITGVTEVSSRGIESPEALQRLSGELALYLRQYPQASVVFDGHRLDPSELELHSREYDLGETVTETGEVFDAKLVIIEWKNSAERALYLCDGAGFALKQTKAGIQASGFNFTAYLRSEAIRHLADNNLLDFDDDFIPLSRHLLERARTQMRDHFRQRLAERSSAVVEKWKSEKIYPYRTEPKTVIDIVERQVFDVVAVQLHDYLPDFEKTDALNRQLSLRLLKQALEESPRALGKILDEVLDLPKEKQEELAELLDRTTLASVINASKIVADRLEFLKGLDVLVFDPTSKEELLERTQLHRILADNTWVFGEEFTLSNDDEPLNAVLKKHEKLIGRKSDDDSPVRREDGTKGIVDLMLSRRIPLPREEEREHLVIELKRPTQKVDDKVAAQIKSYAFAVADDERFRDVKTRWIFWALSNDMSDSIRRETRQRNRPEGVLYEDDEQRIQVWAMTWSQVIERAAGRLKFFQKQLDYTADRESSRTFLNRMHAKYLPASMLDGDASSSGLKSKASARKPSSSTKETLHSKPAATSHPKPAAAPSKKPKKHK